MNALFSFLAAQNSQYGAKELKQQIISSTRTGMFVSLLVMLAFFGIYKINEIIQVIPTTTKGIGNGPIILSDPIIPEIVKIPVQIEPASSIQQTIGTLATAGIIVPVSSDLPTNDFADLKEMGFVSATKGSSDKLDLGKVKLDDYPSKVNMNGVVESTGMPEDTFVDVEKEATIDYAGLQKTIIYPLAALKTGLEGNVVVQVLIGADGKPANTKILSTSNVVFNNEAIRSVMEFTGYKPAFQNQAPVAYWLTVPIKFRLK